MQTKFIEAVSNFNWGKFLLMRFTAEEWKQPSAHPDAMFPLLREVGWHPSQIIVFDLQTCEGAAFRIGGLASADLNKHKVWVCPMFQPFLEWLYMQKVSDFDKLPSLVTIPPEIAKKHEAMFGHRRPGKSPA